MSEVTKVLAFLPVFLLSCFCSFSQQNLPYSRYGLGDMESFAFSANKAMGGVAAAYAGPLNINYQNPASYANISLTTFETAVFFRTYSLATQDSSYQTGHASLDYLAFVFPAFRKRDKPTKLESLGLSAGLLPISQMGYEFEQTDFQPAIGNYTNTYTGSGGLNQVYLGAAFKVAGLSAGVNGAYVFGRLRHVHILTYPDSLDAFNPRNVTTIKPRGIIWNAGLQYEMDAGEKHQLRFGIFGNLTNHFRADVTETWDQFRLVTGGLQLDTIRPYPKHSDTKLQLPGELGLGVAFSEPNKWQVMAEWRLSRWSELTPAPGSENLPLSDSWRLAVGASITPNFKAVNAYRKRIDYRVGFHYSPTRLVVNGQRITELGTTFGFGLPIKKAFSKLNLSFDIGSRGTTAQNLIRENYFKANLGFTLNDKWFEQRKFD